MRSLLRGVLPRSMASDGVVANGVANGTGVALWGGVWSGLTMIFGVKHQVSLTAGMWWAWLL